MLVRTALLSLLLSTAHLTQARSHSKRCDDVPTRLDGHSIDFSTFDSSQQSVEEFLNGHNYHISNQTIGEFTANTIPHIFKKSNVEIVDGALTLLAKGQEGRGIVSSAQIQSFDRFTFGTLETIAKATTTKGACQGIFFYDDDQHEIDIELLSDYYEVGYKDLVAPGVQFTNQALVENQAPTTIGKRYGFDPTADFHNYTIHWTETETQFFVDGRFQTSITQNVPTTAAQIMFNNWSNGNPGWSSGPPRQDAIFSIKSIKYTPL